MFGGGLSGSYSKSSGRSKTNYLMDSQKYGLRGLWSAYFAPYFSSASGAGGGQTGERRGMGLPTYQGKLAGTDYGGVMSNLFSSAENYQNRQPRVAPDMGNVDPATGQRVQWTPEQATVQGDGTDPFAHYSYFANPQERTQAQMEAYQQMMAPSREKEDSMLKQKMANMGLTHSSDMLKAVSDLQATRGAQDTLMGLEMLDKYEALGFEANEAALNRLTDIGTTQYEIINKGLQAEFDEWLRTQPEYNPMIDKMMSYLGLQTKADTTTHGQSWNVKGSASYGSAPQ